MEDEPTSTLFGMAGFRVLAVDEYDGSVNVLAELEREEAPCPGCGTFSASVKQRPVVALADAPIGGRKVKVFWRKRRLRCTRSSAPPRPSPSRHPTTWRCGAG